jgi:hypothetical protein
MTCSACTAAIEKLTAQDPRRAGTAASLDARIAAKREGLLAKRKELKKAAKVYAICVK